MQTKTVTGKVRARVDLSGAVIPRTNLSRANLASASLVRANLSGADLSMAILVEARLEGSVLRDANLSHADLSAADLTGADLSNANLSSAKLIAANLKAAKLDKANLRGAILRDAQNVSWSELLRAYVDESTVFPETLNEELFFDCLQRMTPHLKVDWRADYSNNVEAAILDLNKQLEKVGRGSTISEFLNDADFYLHLRDENNQTN